MVSIVGTEMNRAQCQLLTSSLSSRQTGKRSINYYMVTKPQNLKSCSQNSIKERDMPHHLSVVFFFRFIPTIACHMYVRYYFTYLIYVNSYNHPDTCKYNTSQFEETQIKGREKKKDFTQYRMCARAQYKRSAETEEVF